MKLTLKFALALSLASTSTLAADMDTLQLNNHSVSLSDINSENLTLNNGVSVIDLVAFYQPSFSSLNGAQWAHTRIKTLVDNANEVLSNSGSNSIIRLVNAQQMTGISDNAHYDDINPADRILSPYGANGGYPENNAYLAFGADIALYIRPYNESLNPEVYGYGEVGGELSVVFDVAAINQTDGDYVFAHEVGHNLSAGHVNDDNYTYLPSAHATYCASHYTIMGLTEENNHKFFSDPNVVVKGDSCGVEGEADNSSIVKENAPIAAARRTAPLSVGSVGFSSLDYKLDSASEFVVINLKRTGDLSQETSVEVAFFDDTAKEGVDFNKSFERVSFVSGSDTAELTLPVSADASGKSKAVLRYPYKLDLNEENSEASIVFTETPTHEGVFGFSADSYTVSEGDGTVALSILREGGVYGEKVLRVYTEDGTRKSGVDFVGFDSEFTFLDGQDKLDVVINLIDNNIFDSIGSFSVHLDGISSEISINTVEINLTNNDKSSVDSNTETDVKSSGGGSFDLFFVLLLVSSLALRSKTVRNGNKKHLPKCL